MAPKKRTVNKAAVVNKKTKTVGGGKTRASSSTVISPPSTPVKVSTRKKPSAPPPTPKKNKASPVVASTTPKKAVAAIVNTSTDFAKMTVAQLKQECAKNGLQTDGVKVNLLKRLNDFATSGNCDDQGPPPKVQKQSTIQRAMETMKAHAAKDGQKKRTHKPDQYCGLTNVEVVDDYDCMLNQTNIGHNNNKFYIIQVLKQLSSNNLFYSFNRWGRVGEPGRNAVKSFSSLEDAVDDFTKKFEDKTKNDWETRDNFEPVPGKYTLLEMGDEEEESQQQVVKRVDDTGTLRAYKPSALDEATQVLIKLIFDNDMFKEALIKMEIDVKKMPLGKLSKTQIVKGFEVLDEIKQTLGTVSSAAQRKLEELSSKFYTVIPHNFGRQRPTVLNNQDLLRSKLDMLITLGDIELAQDMLKHKEDVVDESKNGDLMEHPFDVNFKLLQCAMDLVQVSEQEFKVIKKYLENTGGYRVKSLLNVWRMDRKGEGERVKPWEKIAHRKLLWHGTNVAVVAAIMKSGLRIMPHSGGRVGKGIYFASENAKSAGYVGTSKNVGIMFLNEVMLGKEHFISRDDSSLTKPPAGYDSIVARGRVEPDPKQDTTLYLEGKTVVVPQGKPIAQPQYSSSSFSQSEYLVYREDQVRMRYLLQLQMDF